MRKANNSRNLFNEMTRVQMPALVHLTRLGYTYDWGAEGKKYGLTEFLILKDSHVRVQFTKNVPTFVRWLEERN